MLRVVLDANVLVSAAIQLGPSHRIVQAWRERREFALVICPLLVDEVEDVLTMRPRLRRWSTSVSHANTSTCCGHSTASRPTPSRDRQITRAAGDDYIVALARQHVADLIVSGDKDLLEWPEQQPPVVTPETFERRLIALR